MTAITEYTNLETPEAVRAALERGEAVECRSARHQPVWLPLVVDHEDLLPGWEFRAPLPAVQASDAEGGWLDRIPQRAQPPMAHPERTDAEHAYTVTAFDYCRDPVGSQEWCAFWKGWYFRSLYKPPSATPAPPEKASKVVLRPLEWSELDKDEWVEGNFGFYINLDNDEPKPYCATWGEEAPEYYATLDEAKAWCHAELTRWISSVVDVVPPEKAEARDDDPDDGECPRCGAPTDPDYGHVGQCAAPAETREAVSSGVRFDGRPLHPDKSALGRLACVMDAIGTRTPHDAARKRILLSVYDELCATTQPATPDLLARLGELADELRHESYAHRSEAMRGDVAGAGEEARLCAHKKVTAERIRDIIAGAQK